MACGRADRTERPGRGGRSANSTRSSWGRGVYGPDFQACLTNPSAHLTQYVVSTTLESTDPWTGSCICPSRGRTIRAARIPAERGFVTKRELAHILVLRALASSLPTAWVTADSLYGQERRVRHLLEQAQVGYVLAVPKSQQSSRCSGSGASTS
ncbi:transposase [Streptomyces sp. NEAU-H22]|nr:transposase [Streptomyces sp. NEAU-H22]